MKTAVCWIGTLSLTVLTTVNIIDCSAQPSGIDPLSEKQERTGEPRKTPGASTNDAASPDARAASPDSRKGNYDKLDEEREKVWNSSEMLSARAWLETYFERSAKISDAQAKKYLDGLRTLYPNQMKLWLIKFQADRKGSKQQTESERMARQQSISARQASPHVGGFQNPHAGRRVTSSGQPVGNVPRGFGGVANLVAQHQPVQKPFAGQSVQRPLVTSEDVARWEILRDLGWGGRRGY
ncbi:MAG: hypothetical protein ABGX16_12775 [Pirellulales bacterium]